jgi:hypothetical protein
MKLRTTSRLAIAMLMCLTATLVVESHFSGIINKLFNTTAEAAPVFADQTFVRELNIQANDLGLAIRRAGQQR